MTRRPPSPPCSDSSASAAERERILLPIHQICDVDYLFKLIIFGLYGMTCLPFRATQYSEDWIDLQGIKLHDVCLFSHHLLRVTDHRCDSKLKAIHVIDELSVKRIKTSKHSVVPPPLLADLVEIYKSFIRSSLYFHTVCPDEVKLEDASSDNVSENEEEETEQAIALFCHIDLPAQLPINGLKYLAVRFEVGLDPSEDGFGPVGLGARDEEGSDRWEVSLGPMSLMNVRRRQDDEEASRENDAQPSEQEEGVTVDHLWIKSYPEDGKKESETRVKASKTKRQKKAKKDRAATVSGDDEVLTEWVLAKAWPVVDILEDDELVHCFKQLPDIEGWDRGYSQLQKEHEAMLRRQMGRKRKSKGSSLPKKAKAGTPTCSCLGMGAADVPETREAQWPAMTPFSPAPTPPPGSLRADYETVKSRKAYPLSPSASPSPSSSGSAASESEV